MATTLLPGVFRPLSDSRLLADAVATRSGPDTTVLDLCTGSGIIALAAASRGAEVDAVDVSRRAVATVRLNARRLRRPIQAHRGRLFEPVIGRRFDLIAANPPYVPSRSIRLPTRGRTRAWAAGPDGRVILDRICAGVATHLEPGGEVLLVHSSLVDERATIDRLQRAGLDDVEVIERHRGPLGPLMRRQRDAGLLPPETESEDLVVIRGRAAASCDPRPSSVGGDGRSDPRPG